MASNKCLFEFKLHWGVLSVGISSCLFGVILVKNFLPIHFHLKDIAVSRIADVSGVGIREFRVNQ